MSEIRRRMKYSPTAAKDGGPGVVIETVQDVSEILAWNRALYNATDHSGSVWRSKIGAQWTLVASIPNALIDHMQSAKGVNFYTAEGWQWWKKNILNNSDYLSLRTAPGRF